MLVAKSSLCTFFGGSTQRRTPVKKETEKERAEKELLKSERERLSRFQPKAHSRPHPSEAESRLQVLANHESLHAICCTVWKTLRVDWSVVKEFRPLLCKYFSFERRRKKREKKASTFSLTFYIPNYKFLPVTPYSLTNGRPRQSVNSMVMIATRFFFGRILILNIIIIVMIECSLSSSAAAAVRFLVPFPPFVPLWSFYGEGGGELEFMV